PRAPPSFPHGALPISRISAESAAGQQVRVRPIGQPDHEFICRIERINPAGQKQLPSASLAASGGGNLETAIDSGDGLTAAEPVRSEEHTSELQSRENL